MKLLYEFVKECKQKFGKDLVSIILFGSYARGTAKETSDVELLVIAKNLPRNMFKRLSLLDDFVIHAIKKYHIRVFPIFYEPEELSTEFVNPLIYVLIGYKVLFGESFWVDFLQRPKPKVKETKPIFIGEREWEIEKLI